MSVFPWLLIIICTLYLFLTINVIKHRRKTRQALGNNLNDENLQRAIRAHSNFVEISPFGIASFWLMTQVNIPNFIILAFGITFIGGRILHAYSLLHFEPRYNSFRLRIAGMVFSFLTIIAGCGVFILMKLVMM